MSTFKLGAYNLPAAETVLVKTLLRLFQHDQGKPFHWTFAEAPPYDALLLEDAATAEARAVLGVDYPDAVLRLTGFHAPDAPDTMQRPMRADRLQDWLKHAEKSYGTNSGGTQATAQAILPFAPAPALKAPRKPAPQPADPGLGSDTSAAIYPDKRLRLKRWPPATLLGRDPGRIRMATLLSRRPLSSSDLIRLSGQPAAQCALFLNLIEQVGLLDVQATRPASEPALARSPAQAPADQQPTFARGLIAGIRRRLGIAA